MRVRTPQGIGTVIEHNKLASDYLVSLDDGPHAVRCDVADAVELPPPNLPPLNVPVGTRARNVQSAVVGTVLGYYDRIGGGKLVYIVADGNTCPVWRDPTLWERVE